MSSIKVIGIYVSGALEAMKEISKYVELAASKISPHEVETFVNTLMDAYNLDSKILIVGTGRSGLVGKAFAMRLMHLGFRVYVIGETITPPVDRGDILIAISGSGVTELTVTVARIAQKLGAKIIAITSYPDSPLGRLAKLTVRVPGRTKIAEESNYIARQILGIHEPLAPLGTLFENTTMAFLDGVIVELMKRLEVDEETLRRRHSNVELP